MSLDDVVPADGIRVVTLPSGREVKFVYGQGRWMLE